MTLTVRPVRRTPHADAWVRVVEALGGVVTSRDGDRVDLALGHGRVAVIRADESAAELGFEAPDLFAVAAECERNGLATVSAGGRLEVTGPDGLRVHVDERPDAAPPRGADAALSTLPLWYSPDVAGAAGVLSRLGLSVRIASHTGDWVDFVAPGGGLVAAHGADRPSVQISFEYDGDVRALAERLSARGLTASVVDENYGLTVRVPDPDGGGDIFVNQVQTDLHGFRRAGA
ncbi:glyoxalase/bleomycin resistance/dioxygenase family protein [Jiangella alba]|uniref:Glyoxalase-like domain-containing protein n=1 Tax=Jiangella alba TaxID=561176 RepID=A0A1H5PFD4_9ACTN|nr:glyoxalase/bleomycin resistance/dioxygenase family protein [Jiangella alba]SEF12334.1 hypothetical protein SAMN04488561_4223 [Jiangella alba]